LVVGGQTAALSGGVRHNLQTPHKERV